MYTVTIAVPSSYTGLINNTAAASSDIADPDASNNNATVATSENALASLVLTKVVDNLNPNVGSNVVFTITVTNNGPSDATGIDVVDQLPSGYSFVSALPSQGVYDDTTGLWTVGSLSDTSVATLAITALVNATGNFTNIAEITSADQPDPNGIVHGNNTPGEIDQDDVTTTPISVSNLITTKNVDNATPNTGDIVTYTLTVVNNGPSIATNVSLTDNLPTGTSYVSHIATGGSVNTYSGGVWNIGTIDIGDSATLTINALVTAQGTAAQTPIVNTATAATGDQFDPTTIGDDLVEPITVTASELVTTKTVAAQFDGTFDEGDTVVYTITVENQGPSNATNVSLVDLLPAGLTFSNATVTSGVYNSGDGNWDIGTIANGATETLTISAIINQGTSGNTIVNTTTAATGDQSDPNLVADDLTESITVSNDADIVLTKVVDNPTPNTGDTVTYTITVTNNGEAVVTNLVVTDVLPVGLQLGLVTPSSGTWTAPNWNIGTLGVGLTETITIEAVVTAQGTLAQLPIINVATHTQDQNDSSPITGNSAIVTVTAANLVTVKTVNVNTPDEGDTVTYTIRVENQGPSNATNVSLVDLLPDGLTFSNATATSGVYNSGDGNWVIGSITSGTTETLTISATVNEGTSGNTITNITTAAIGDQTDPTTVGDDLDQPITVTENADIVLVKTVDNPTPNTGDTITYNVVVTNNGPSLVTNLVITDAMPAGLILGNASPSIGTWNSGIWTIGSLASGVSETITIEALVTAEGTVPQTQLINTVTNSQDQIDTNLTEDSPTAIVTVTASELVTTKTVAAQFDGTFDEGDTVVYTITVENQGPSNATNVSLVDLLPAGLTFSNATVTSGVYNSGDGNWDIGTIANGATETLTISAIINQGTSGNTIVNTTTAATGDQSDPNLVADDLTESITVSNDADIVLTKVVDNPTPNIGDIVTYTITVTNKGEAVVTNLVVTDALPSGLTYNTVSPSDGIWTAPNWNIGTLQPNEQETIIIKAMVGLDQGGQTIINTISNSQDQIDSNITQDDFTATITVTSADLAVVKTVSNATPNEGDTITYTIVLTNNGPSTATGVSLIDNLPVGVTYVSSSTSLGNYNNGSGLWTVGSLLNAASATLTITATVNDGTLGQTIINATNSLLADQADLNSANNQGSVSIVPTAFIDLSLVKTVVDDVVAPEVGDMITFEIRVSNDGPTEATGVQVTDLIPSGYDFVNYSSSIGTYNPITGLWNIGFIEVGNTAVLLIDVIVLENGTYINCAEVTAANEIDIDSTPNNGIDTEDDFDCAAAPPIQAVDLGITKTVVANNTQPLVETEVSFEIRLTNHGDIDATEVIVTDLLPSGYRFINYSSTRGTYDDTSGVWNVGKIINGETEVLIVDAIVNATGDYLNCATITSLHQTDINSANNLSCIATNPIPVADLELTKDVNELEPYAETNVEFTINLTNVGPSSGTGVVVKDVLPSGYTFVSYTATIGSYNASTGLWNVGTIVSDATETLTIVAYVLPIGEWTNVAEVIASNELDIDSAPGNNDQYEDDQAAATTEPIVLLTIPEGFTPNGDGINDVFEIEHLQVLYPNFSMEIVNRYGNKVFEYKHNGNPYQTPQWWNGYSTGRWNFTNDPLPTGTYFYTIYFNNDERKPQTGWIYLRR